ncbi:hypothetical protein CBE01nite_43110 [Clostridium beijerinckii]|uniref:Uncharacterized protein n=1 Tax=Clostridium beijerinckii TaxID=1520 RepID=A0AB74VGY5_CLOBE|nr:MULTISPECIES: hypothetical protein [Clostridium]NRZ24834.1 hypothetical protein [Clostridium beijerinckii]NYB98952.1 hypothetical protein [Clostridium beijerinckii]OOM24984.1 hypothetical protein CLBEI_18350 [Clostridium beijerinckii]QUN35639.1 hypothetical protein KEC93_02035 [Clostridium beijerinckii]SQB22000.1 Uncharacterised protein [Clostridium beijerinckii]
MKRFTILFLIFLCLTFSVIRLIPAFAVGNIFTQGIYKLSDFNFSKTGIFTIQNISNTEGMYLYILDENQVVMESIRLRPSTQKLDTVPIKPNYIVLIIGKGEVYLNPKSS